MTRRDGMYVLAGRLDPEGAAHLSAALRPPRRRPAPTSRWTARTPAAPTRRMGDALVDLGQAPAGRRGPPRHPGGLPTQVIVTMTLDQLTPPTHGQPEAEAGSAEIVGGTIREPISAPAGPAAWPATPGSCPPSSAGPARCPGPRAPPGAPPAPPNASPSPCATRAAPPRYCDRPPSWCEAHHLIPWPISKKTDLNNLALVCDAHHDLLHHDHWTITLQDGRASRTHHPPPPPQPPDPTARRGTTRRGTTRRGTTVTRNHRDAEPPCREAV